MKISAVLCCAYMRFIATIIIIRQYYDMSPRDSDHCPVFQGSGRILCDNVRRNLAVRKRCVQVLSIILPPKIDQYQMNVA